MDKRSRNHVDRRPKAAESRVRTVAFVLLLACLLAGERVGVVLAGGLTMKDGLELRGTPIKRTAITLELARGNRDNPIYSLMTVEDGVRRYMFPFRHAVRDSVDSSRDIGIEKFQFDQRINNRAAEPADIGGIDHSVPFGGRAARKIEVQTGEGAIEIAQGVLLLRPDFLQVASLDIAWDYGLLIDEVSDESLMSLLDSATNPLALQDLLSRVGFLIKANRLELARFEMKRLTENFPEQKDRVEAFEKDLNNLTALKALREIRERKRAGQHDLVRGIALKIRDSALVKDATKDQADDLLFEYEQLKTRYDEIVFQLEQLEGDLEEFDAARVRPLRPVLQSELRVETIDRLEGFERSLDDDTLTPAEKLAIAYSSWVAGPDNGTSDIDDAVDYWTLRAAVLDFARADNRYQRDERFAVVESIEGVDIKDLEALIPLLPPVAPPTDIAPGGTQSLTTPSGVDYTLVLPPEYSPARSYPVLIALHDRGLTPELEAKWWAGSAGRQDLAQRRGYIVAAPNYLGTDSRLDAKTHDRIEDVLVDLRRRFRVDSDRAFLVGHGQGADVVWDAGLARPLTWAGLVPIGGRCSPSVKASWENAAYTQIYAVNGGLDARTFGHNASTLQRMMENRHNIVLCEYINRGREPYSAEKPRIFDWMLLQQRRPLPTKIDAKVFDATDTAWMWYRPAGRSNLVAPNPGERPPGQRLDASVTLGNKIYLASQPGTVMLSPRVVDYQKRVRFQYGGQTLKTRLLEPSMKTMLEDFALRGDRECLFWNEIRVP